MNRLVPKPTTCLLGLKVISWVQHNGTINDYFVTVYRLRAEFWNTTNYVGIWQNQLPRLNTDFDWFCGGLPKSGLRERSWKPSGRYAARGFESHILLRVQTLRQKSVSSWFNDFWCLFIRATTACNAWKRIAKVLRAHGSSYRLDNSAGRVADF